MARIAFTCPECRADIALTVRRLLLRTDEGSPPSGEVLVTCLACQATGTLPVASPTITALLAAGVSFLALSAPAVVHPESAPGGPPLTYDDLLDLHGRLGGDGWYDELVPRER